MSKMTFDNLDFVQLLPAFMREDPAVVACARQVEKDIKAITTKLPTFNDHRGVDYMSESELDEMAWEQDVDWYDSGAAIEAKREMLRFAALIKAKRGTEYSVVEILKAHFGSGWVREWFTYGGRPFHFKVFTSNPQVIQEQYAKFMAEVKLSKNARSVLDTVGFYWKPETGQLEIGFIPDRRGMFEHLHCGVAFYPKEEKIPGIPFNISIKTKSGCFLHEQASEDQFFTKKFKDGELKQVETCTLEFSGGLRRFERITPFAYQKRIKK